MVGSRKCAQGFVARSVSSQPRRRPAIRRHAGFALPALLEAAQPPQHITRPADGLAAFAVIDDVEAELDLLPHHLGDAVMQTIFERRLVVALSVAFCGQKFAEPRRVGPSCRHAWSGGARRVRARFAARRSYEQADALP